jgi:hypothetical protein
MGTGAATPPEPPGRQSASFAPRGEQIVFEKLVRETLFFLNTSVCVLSGYFQQPAEPSRPLSGAPSAAKAEGRQREDKSSSMMSMSNGNDQADRTISTGKLHALPHFHTRPINVVVFHGSQGNTRFQVGFPLRCLQRLSLPYIATLLCPWQDNRSTRDMSIPVLSY